MKLAHNAFLLINVAALVYFVWKLGIVLVVSVVATVLLLTTIALGIWEISRFLL